MKDGSLTDYQRESAEKLIKMELCIPERSGLGLRMEKELELWKQKGKSRRIKWQRKGSLRLGSLVMGIIEHSGILGFMNKILFIKLYKNDLL